MRDSGFTLIELLATIMIATIIVATGMPPFMSALRTYKGAEARDKLVTRIRTARQMAITRHVPVIVRFGDGVQTSEISDYYVHVDTNGDRIVQSTEHQIAYTLPKEVLFKKVSLVPRDSLVFDISGALWPGTTGGSVVLDSRAGPETLMVSAVGMVYQP